jgi:hypothetical protein
MRFQKLSLVLSAALLLSACASNNALYQWGNYEEALFVNYHEPAVKEEMLDSYLNFVREQDNSTKPLAPGLYAEAGTFMLKQGNAKAAIEFYKMEREHWPESKELMTTLIDNLEERTQ